MAKNTKPTTILERVYHCPECRRPLSRSEKRRRHEIAHCQKCIENAVLKARMLRMGKHLPDYNA